MLVVRQAYGCDCDGASHEATSIEITPETSAVRSMAEGVKGAIEQITGLRPTTCPWRAFHDPFVREVVDLCVLGDKGFGSAVAGAELPAVLIDGVVVYERAKLASRAEFIDQRRKENEQKK